MVRSDHVEVIRSVEAMKKARRLLTGQVGLVPTMGYLHEGHLSLVRRCVTDNDHTTISIFVNPTQFGTGEDLERYPRDEGRDLELLEADGADIVFIPSVDEIYPPGFDDWVTVPGPITERLESEHRPGHFRGVTTVVARLFRIIQPHRAYFGRKDAQQLQVIRRMVADIVLPVEIVGMPIVREPDGLAMSSRNVYLSQGERRAALVLSRSLARAEAMVQDGEWDAAGIRAEVEGIIAGEALVVTDYVSFVDEETFEEIAVVDRPALLLLAARVGQTRLIDNVALLPLDDLPIGRG
ncbi:MAG: pantoate--beta-alanine ligase [Dehalococcoidia bacterium]